MGNLFSRDNEHTGRFRRRHAAIQNQRPESVPWADVEYEDTRDPEEIESDIDSALIERLRNMEWPKPSPEVRERCLRQILSCIEGAGEGKDEDAEGEDEAEQAPDEKDEDSDDEDSDDEDYRPPRGQEQRHPLTRRVVVSAREPLRLPERPVRLGVALWSSWV